MTKQSVEVPHTLQAIARQFPSAWKAYQAFRDACDRSGPLNPKTRELIKIAVEVAKKRHGGLAAHIRRAQKAGASTGEISQTILLAAPLVGLPDVLNAFQVAEPYLE